MLDTSGSLITSPCARAQACTVVLRALAVADAPVPRSQLLVQLVCEDGLCRDEPGGARVSAGSAPWQACFTALLLACAAGLRSSPSHTEMCTPVSLSV